MQIDILTDSPELLKGPFDHSILKKAMDKGVVSIQVLDSTGPTTLETLGRYDEVILVSANGNQLTQPKANRLSGRNAILIVCNPHLLDVKASEAITDTISIGSYSISSSEFAAAIIVDSVVRLLPGAISDETSALFDSHQDGLLAPPIYTRPAVYKCWEVPSILLSGNEKAIENWRMEQALAKTRMMRPNYLDTDQH